VGAAEAGGGGAFLAGMDGGAGFDGAVGCDVVVFTYSDEVGIVAGPSTACVPCVTRYVFFVPLKRGALGMFVLNLKRPSSSDEGCICATGADGGSGLETGGLGLLGASGLATGLGGVEGTEGGVGLLGTTGAGACSCTDSSSCVLEGTLGAGGLGLLLDGGTGGAGLPLLFGTGGAGLLEASRPGTGGGAPREGTDGGAGLSAGTAGGSGLEGGVGLDGIEGGVGLDG